MKKPRVAAYVSQLVIAGISLASCSNDPIVHLGDENISVGVSLNFSGSEWTVTVANEHGSASDTIFAANDHRRSNIYLTPKRQLVVIEQGGGDAFFTLPDGGPPEALTGPKTRQRDTKSEYWRYLGVIAGKKFDRETPECIALLGAGSSPYRLEHQELHFC